MDKAEIEALAGRWTHSHEEDGPDCLVFRPDGWHFPPSRGRRSFDLHPDGKLVGAAPGPTDQIVSETGTWRLLAGDVLQLDREGHSTRLKIIEATPEKLVVER